MTDTSDDGERQSIRKQFRDTDPVFYAGDDLHAKKQDKIQGLLEDRGLDALLMFKSETIRYMTDFYTKGFGPFMDFEYLCVVPKGEKPVLGFLSGSDRYRSQLQDLVTDVRRLPGVHDWGTVIEDIFDDYSIDGHVGTDIMPFFLYEDVQQRCPDVEFVDANDIWGDLTAIKTEEEVQLVEEATSIAELGMQAAIDAVEPGVKEIEITAAAEEAMRSEGSEFTPFVSDIVSGKNTAVFSRVPSEKRVRNGDMVVMDLGAVRKGYTGEFARTTVAGEPSEKQREIYQVVRRSLEECLDAIEPGATCHEVDQAARQVLRDAGYGEYEHTRGTGHQLGYGLHGEPLIDEGVHEELEPGMIVNVEPRIAMFDQPEVGAVQLEDTVLITEDGTEQLTRTQYEPKLME
jgi:Xaa-Pro aminopeptidase